MKIKIKDMKVGKNKDSQSSHHKSNKGFGNGFSDLFRNHMLFFILLILFNLVNVMTLFTNDSAKVGSVEVDSDVIIEVVNDDVDSAVELAGSFDDEDVPKEYTEALDKAKIYTYEMHLSKSGVYRQLTSRDGDKFSEESAGYAINQLDVDWKENALLRGRQYLDNPEMDLDMVYNYLASEDADRFLIDEAQYAIDNLK